MERNRFHRTRPKTKYASFARAISSVSFVIFFGTIAAVSQVVESWNYSKQPIAEAVCTEQRKPGSGERSYRFRTVKWPYPVLKGYGVRRWYERLFGKIIPGLGPDLDKYSEHDVRFIDGKYGRPVPLGESERSKKTRAEAEKKLTKLRLAGELEWQDWQKNNLNATMDDTAKARSTIFAHTSGAAQLPSFDWRNSGLDLRPVLDQGFTCNTCWAFSTIDAMQIARSLMGLRTNRQSVVYQNETSIPGLVSCMKPRREPEEFCTVNWHGEAFSYMVDHGMPLGSNFQYVESEYKTWRCDKASSIKALTWDFVSPTPMKVPSNEELKQAIITYGPVVTTLNLDECLMLYGGGIFDEQITKDGPYHMMLIVGWDDEKGAWLVKNSFGIEWGEQGYGWVKYESNNIGKWAAWIMPDPKVEDRLANSKN